MIIHLLKPLRIFRLYHAGLCLAISLPALALADTPAAVLDRLSIPAGASVKTVTSLSVHNGMSVAIATFNSAQSLDSVVDYYRHYWKGDDHQVRPGFVESFFDEWQLISQLHNGHNIVVQLAVKPPNGTTGFISVMAIGTPARRQKHGSFSDLKLLSSNRSVDGADTSLMRVYAASSSVSQSHEIYRQRLIDSGWQVLSDSDADGARVMILARDQSRLEVSIVASRDYGSVVVAHQVTSK